MKRKKQFIVLQFILVAICLQLTSCGYPETPMVKFKGLEDKNDLVFFYKKGTTYEQKELFQNNVVHKPHPEGRGYDLQDGVIDLMLIRNSDFEGYAINFSKDATSEQRNKLKEAIEDSSIIHKVYENVTPSKITDL